ncbi:hypothetical protein ABG768_028007, partial [Culter alburnus]
GSGRAAASRAQMMDVRPLHLKGLINALTEPPAAPDPLRQILHRTSCPHHVCPSLRTM